VRNYITRRQTVATIVATPFLGVFSSPGLGTTTKRAVVARSLHPCFVEAGGRRRELRIGDPIYVGDTVDVSEGAKLKLRMDDGSLISLASGSQLMIHAFGLDTGAQQRDARLTLSTGLLRAVVSPLNEASIFEVDCPAGKAEVRSTDWFMEAQPGSMRVGVLAGRVVLTSLATGRRVTIPGRWGAHLEAGLDPVPARLWSSDEFADVIARTEVP
jgi:hypothetical protein